MMTEFIADKFSNSIYFDWFLSKKEEKQKLMFRCVGGCGCIMQEVVPQKSNLI